MTSERETSTDRVVRDLAVANDCGPNPGGTEEPPPGRPRGDADPEETGDGGPPPVR